MRAADYFFGSRKGLLRTGLLVLLVLAICLGFALALDREIALAIREGVPRDTRRLFARITEFGRAEYYLALIIPLWLFARAAFLRAAPRPVAQSWYGFARGMGYLMASLALSTLFVQSLKLLVGRARPKALFQDNVYGAFPFSFDTTLSSFPSGHSQTIWTLMTCMMILFPRAWPLFFSWAFLIAGSRLVTGAHFPSDVLAGSMIGILSALYVKERWYRDHAMPRFSNWFDYGDAR